MYVINYSNYDDYYAYFTLNQTVTHTYILTFHVLTLTTGLIIDNNYGLIY